MTVRRSAGLIVAGLAIVLAAGIPTLWAATGTSLMEPFPAPRRTVPANGRGAGEAGAGA
ncbi:MAG: hypothetical protein IPH43_03180 [Xanthomonadales bacterium]|nr:hypothetical protein [Xanthomonadales bacterium]